MIVCVCGADGAGKQTQTTILAKKLDGTRFAFPNYDSPTGIAILRHLQNDWFVSCAGDTTSTTPLRDPVDPLVFQCLQTVNRFELLPQINAAAARGHVVFDRYTASGVVYGGLDGLDTNWVEQINAALPQPDVWIYLDIPIEESFKRRPERRDRIESNRPYLEKVRSEYLKLFQAKQAEDRMPSGRFYTGYQVWNIVDGIGTVSQVHERIWDIVEPLLERSRDV